MIYFDLAWSFAWAVLLSWIFVKRLRMWIKYPMEVITAGAWICGILGFIFSVLTIALGWIILDHQS